MLPRKINTENEDSENLNLALLPSDIILGIIKFEQHSIIHLRLISWHWNEAADEHFYVRKLLPVINSLEFRADFHNSRYIIRMLIHEDYRNYFGVESWSIVSSSAGIVEICAFVSYTKLINGQEECRKRYLMNRLMRLTMRCSIIERFELYSMCDYEHFKDAFGNFLVKELVLSTFSVSVVSKIYNPMLVDFIKTHSVHHLILNFRSFLWEHPAISAAKQFVDLSIPLVSKIELNLFERARATHRRWFRDWQRAWLTTRKNAIIDSKQFKASINLRKLTAPDSYHICLIVDRETKRQ